MLRKWLLDVVENKEKNLRISWFPDSSVIEITFQTTPLLSAETFSET